MGARDWSGFYINSCTTLLQTSGSTEASLQEMEDRVRDVFPPEEGDDDEELEGWTGRSDPSTSVEEDSTDKGEGDEQAKEGKEKEPAAEQRVARRHDDTLTIFQSPALQFFQQRTFQGLEYSADMEQSTSLQQGLFGTASGYATATATKAQADENGKKEAT